MYHAPLEINSAVPCFEIEVKIDSQPRLSVLVLEKQPKVLIRCIDKVKREACVEEPVKFVSYNVRESLDRNCFVITYASRDRCLDTTRL